MGFRSDAGWLCEAVFRRGAVRKPVVQAEDFTANEMRIDFWAYGLDEAGEFMSGNRASPFPTVRCVGGWIPLQLRRRHARGINADKHSLERGWGTKPVAATKAGATVESLKRTSHYRFVSRPRNSR